jgi:predicted RecB family nuclease
MLDNATTAKIATGDHPQVPPDWMPASQVRPLIFENPALLWLEYHGAQFGFTPDSSPYDYLDFITAKSRQFEAKWLQEMAPGAVTVCHDVYEVRSVTKVKETLDLMLQGIPLIAQAALWWAPERIYGVPDLLVHTDWLKEHFPGLPEEKNSVGHYVVFDLKFTTKLEESSKAKDLQNYAAQVRLYTFMLGHLQGIMPSGAFLVTRDRVNDPLPVEITSVLNEPLDADLAALRDQFIEIKVNGSRYVPWKDAIVAANLANSDERWATAKETIAREKIPGGDPALIVQVGPKLKQALAAMGYSNLQALLLADPDSIPLESIKGIGPGKAGQIRAVLRANRTGQPALPPFNAVPPRKKFEFFVDFEYFTNINVDFERQWPALEGCEMLFMAGVGRAENETWSFDALVAQSESLSAEREMLEALIQFLIKHAGPAMLDPSQTALYHWTSAEVWQAQRAADRHSLPLEHPLRGLPWVDLHKVFTNGPTAVPGAWDFGLKDIAKALGSIDPDFTIRWPEGLDQGQRAMVMGWKAYQPPQPLKSVEFDLLLQYLEQDCAALQHILAWLRKV